SEDRSGGQAFRKGAGMIGKNKTGILAILLTSSISIVGCKTIGYQAGRGEGLKGYWSFNEGKGVIAKNAVGENHAIVQPDLKWVDGKRGKAIQYDGENYVVIPHEDFFNAPNFTVSVWVKLEQTYNYHYIIWKDGIQWPEEGPGRRIDIWVEMTGPVTVMWNYQDRLDGRKVIADGKWHHIAEVYDGKSIKLYIDGALDAQAEPSGKLPTNNLPMWIGARPGNVAAKGVIDEVRFYDRALSEQEIKALSGS
ncbi:MAG: LamG domain-containing protein, partial [Planctomycetota bacterium]|nr:LamG domain-containing protein [Planctomycetota bacterium]